MKGFDSRSFLGKTTHEEITYTGQEKPNLGIKPGDSFSKLIDALENAASVIKDLEAKVDFLLKKEDQDASSIKSVSTLYDLVDKTAAVSSVLEGKKINLAVRESALQGKAELVFDFATAVASLSSEYVPVSIDTSVRTYNAANKLLGSSSSKTGSITVDKLAGPVIVTSKINLKSTEGDIILSKSFYLPVLAPDELSGVFGVSGVSTFESKFTTQKEVNEILASNVSRLNKSFEALEKQLNTSTIN